MTELLSPLFGQESNSGSPLQFLLLPLVLAGIFFLLIRPQRKRQKELQQLREQIGVGDEVMTSSGIYGFITGEEDDLFWLEIDDDVQIRISKAAIHSRIPDASESDSQAESTAKEIAAADDDDAPSADDETADDGSAGDGSAGDDANPGDSQANDSKSGDKSGGASRSSKRSSGTKQSSQRPAAKTSGANRSKSSKSKTAGAEAES